MRVLFNAPIDPLTVNGSTIQVSGGSQTVMPSSISFSQNNQMVQVTPQEPLPASTMMTLTIAGVTDMAGNPVTSQTTHFTTGAAPQTSTTFIVNTNPPASQSNVPVNVAPNVQSSAAIDPTSLNSTSFQIYDTVLSQTVAGTYSLSSDGLTAYFLPNTLLAAGRTYYEYVDYSQNVLDLVGNAVRAYFQTFATSFSVSTQGPQVVAVSPQNGLTAVPI